MILGLGVDIVECRRFEGWLKRPGLLGRYFSREEIALVESRCEARRAETLAVRFAAREALGKALGTGLRGLVLRELPVAAAESGRPVFDPSPGMKRILQQRGVETMHLSLSHERDSAVAVVCLEGPPGEVSGV